MSRKNEVAVADDNQVVEIPPELKAFEILAERINGLSTRLNVKPFDRMFVLARAINELREALTDDVMQPIMNLMGSRVGFKTDKDIIKNKDTNWVAKKGPGYPLEIVREVTMEAILYGAYMTGNEVNIIAGNMYATKEHFVRKVRELEGLTDLDVQIGTPVIEKEAGKDEGNAIARIRCKAQWKMHGVDQSVGMNDDVPLIYSTRVYDRSGGQSVASDMAIGKVTRKLYKLIFETATNSKITIPDGDAEEVAQSAREVPAKIVERGNVNFDDFKPGNPESHTPVDAPFDPDPEVQAKKAEVRDSLFKAEAADKKIEDAPLPPPLGQGEVKKRDEAYAFLNNRYNDHSLKIDNYLLELKMPILRDIPKDTHDRAHIEALCRVKAKIAKEMSS